MNSEPVSLPGRRWLIGTLLGAGVLVNYFDRINLSVAAPQLQAHFGLGSAEIGVLFSAFFWSYALLQIPAGLILDRLGVTKVGRWGSFLWFAASALTACAGSFGGILVARMMLGAAEAPGFPANAKAVGHWFPRRERSLATALFDAAAKASSVIGVPLIALVVVKAGWRWGFAATAVMSLAYFVAFTRLYRDPKADPRLSKAELDYILAGGGNPEGVSAARPRAMLGHLLRQRKVWGLSLGFAAYGYAFYLFLTWLPSYLVQSAHMDILKSATYAAIPWMCATVADLLVGGWLIDHLVARGHDETRVRKTVLLTGMALGMAVIGAVFTTNPMIAIVWISVALSGLAAAAPVGWSLPALIAPKGAAGTVGGIMNFANNAMGAVAPIVTGVIVGLTGSFALAFAVAGVVLLGGMAAFIFLLGRIEPVQEP